MERFANNADSTLNGAINNSTTSIVVADGSSFPSVGDFRLLLGSDPDTGEIVLVTARSSNTLTVIRGQESTAAQSWIDGTTVTHILTKGAIESLRDTLKGKTLDTSLETIGASQDGYALTWVNTDGYWVARPGSPFTTSGNELNTTRTVSLDSLGSFSSSHGDGLSRLYVNGSTLSTKFVSGEIPTTVVRVGYASTALQTFTVPATVTSIQVKMWGPGGGTGNYSASGGGGPGGFTTGNLSVTPGETLYLAVGSGGKKPVSVNGNGGNGGWPGGGFGGRGDASAGGGGGFTGIFSANSISQANALMVAGGGGGSSGYGNYQAGGGGGLTGGTGASISGRGGSQVAGGADGNGNVGSTTIAAGSNGQSLPQSTINVVSATAFSNAGVLYVTTSDGIQIVGYTGKTGTTFTGCTGGTGTMSTGGTVINAVAGSAFTGGIPFTNQTTSQGFDSGGGGSGYFGGGAGQGDGAAGGGGSGFLHATRVTGGATTTGSNATNGSTTTAPPNATDPYYVSGMGAGAAASGTGNDGGDGYVVIIYGGQTVFDERSINLNNNTTITTSNLDTTVKADGYIKLHSATLLHGQVGTDLITLSTATTGVKLDINSVTTGRLFQAGAWAIGDNATNNTSSAAQAGLTGALINLASSSGSFTSVANQSLIFNQSGALNLQGNTEVRFNTSTLLRGYFDSNGIFRVGPNANLTATLQGANWPITGTDNFWMYNASGSSWAEIISGGSTTRAAIQIWNNALSNTCGVSLFGAGTGHATPEYAGNGTIEQSGNSTSALVFAKRNGADGLSFASTGAIWQSGAWTIGRATNNDTSTEAQAGLTGPLLNLTQTTGGTLTTVANQGLLYNVAGTVTLQGNAGHSLIASTTTVASTSTTKFITNVGRRVNTVVTTTNLGVSAGTEVIIVGAIASSITITLPSGPTAGDIYTIKDQLGNAATNNIIVSGNGNNIDGVSSYTMNANYQSITVVFANGTWSII